MIHSGYRSRSCRDFSESSTPRRVKEPVTHNIPKVSFQAHPLYPPKSNVSPHLPMRTPLSRTLSWTSVPTSCCLCSRTHCHASMVTKENRCPCVTIQPQHVVMWAAPMTCSDDCLKKRLNTGANKRTAHSPVPTRIARKESDDHVPLAVLAYRQGHPIAQSPKTPTTPILYPPRQTSTSPTTTESRCLTPPESPKQRQQQRQQQQRGHHRGEMPRTSSHASFDPRCHSKDIPHKPKQPSSRPNDKPTVKHLPKLPSILKNKDPVKPLVKEKRSVMARAKGWFTWRQPGKFLVS